MPKQGECYRQTTKEVRENERKIRVVKMRGNGGAGSIGALFIIKNVYVADLLLIM